MAVVKMQLLSVTGLKKNRKAVLETLQSLGIMEVTTDFIDDEGLKKMETDGQRTTFLKRAESMDEALKILKTYVPEKTGLLDSFAGRKVLNVREYQNFVGQRGLAIEAARNIGNNDKRAGPHLRRVPRPVCGDEDDRRPHRNRAGNPNRGGNLRGRVHGICRGEGKAGGSRKNRKCAESAGGGICRSRREGRRKNGCNEDGKRCKSNGKNPKRVICKFRASRFRGDAVLGK